MLTEARGDFIIELKGADERLQEKEGRARMHTVEVKSILSAGHGMNLYRGCTHGCIYCDSRSVCYGFTHRFEDIEVKINAPALLERALKAKRKRCMISTGSMCDPYLPLEEELCLTRRCLELIDRHAFGAVVLTKSDLVLRDAELLADINERAGAVVQMTLTTADESLCRIVEPNVCPTSRRAEVLCAFRERGVPTMVWLSPILPLINDSEENLRAILSYCAEAGVRGIVCFGMGLTLRDGSREYYYRALERHFPGLKAEYIRRYGNAYELLSPNSERLMRLFTDFCEKYGILSDVNACFAYLRELPEREEQYSLF